MVDIPCAHITHTVQPLGRGTFPERCTGAVLVLVQFQFITVLYMAEGGNTTFTVATVTFVQLHFALNNEEEV